MRQLPLLSEKTEGRLQGQLLRIQVRQLEKLSGTLYLDWQVAEHDQPGVEHDELWEAHERAHRTWVAKRAELKRIEKARPRPA